MAKALTHEEFITKAILIQSSNIDLSKVKFETTRKKVELGCKVCGNTWSITAKIVHLKPLQCPYCTERQVSSAYSDQPTTLYFLKIFHKDLILYKVGITKHDVRTRFKDIADIRKIVIQKELRFETGKYAYELECLIKETFKEFRYKYEKGEKVLLGDGNTELYTENIYEKIKGML